MRSFPATAISGHYVAQADTSCSYMGSAAGASSNQLQAVLLNHTAIVNSISGHVKIVQQIKTYTNASYIMGETNSLSGGGATGLSNVFGAALWVVDYTLWQAVQSIGRVQFHQSGTAPYSAWSPSADPPTTNAPYYGNVMAAAAVGNAGNTKIVHLELGDGETASGYALYDGNRLARAVVLNMLEWRSDSTSSRPNATFALQVPRGIRFAKVQRLSAAGANVTSNVTLGGVSYDYDRAQGKPVVVDKAAQNERIYVAKNGSLSIPLPATEGALLYLFQ